MLAEIGSRLRALEEDLARTRQEVERVGRGVYLLSQSQRGINEEIGALPQSWRRFVEEFAARAPVEDPRVHVLEGLMPMKDTFLAARRQGIWQDPTSQSVFAALEGRLDQTLADLGAQPLAQPGMPFNARSHHAILASHHGAPAGTVTAVVRQGYVLGGRMLRLAEVEVSLGPLPPAPAQRSETGEESVLTAAGLSASEAVRDGIAVDDFPPTPALPREGGGSSEESIPTPDSDCAGEDVQAVPPSPASDTGGEGRPMHNNGGYTHRDHSEES